MAHYLISVLLTGGEAIESPAFETREAAETELGALREEMRGNAASQRSWLAVSNPLGTIRAASVIERAGVPPR